MNQEAAHKRFFPPSCFGHAYVQECLIPGCGNVMVIEGKYRWAVRDGRWEFLKPRGLEEGDIWACTKCRTPHEFYISYRTSATPGLNLKMGTVRALVDGKPVRDNSGEPGIEEFAVK